MLIFTKIRFNFVITSPKEAIYDVNVLGVPTRYTK